MSILTCECCGKTVFICASCTDGESKGAAVTAVTAVTAETAETVPPASPAEFRDGAPLRVVETFQEAVDAGWSEQAAPADPWGVVEPLIEQFVRMAPEGRAGLCQYMFAAQDNSPIVKAFRQLGGIERAVTMTLPCSLDEEILSKFRVPGLDAPEPSDIAACLIQLGSFFGLPPDLRALPDFSAVDPTVLSQREGA